MSKIYNTVLGSFMLSKNISVMQLAKKCNVGMKTIYNWAHKKTRPQDIKQINKLAFALDVDVNVLVEYFKK